MAVHVYECLFLLDPNKASADLDGIIHQLNGTITKAGGEIVDTRLWGEPKLAYPIEKFRKGTYVLCYFKSEAKNIVEMEAQFRLNDNILRQMVLKLHPHIAEGILAHLQGGGDYGEPQAAAAGRH
ncbi:MAG: 30S ribosomal protein S6 [Planctomycetota bacterium]